MGNWLNADQGFRHAGAAPTHKKEPPLVIGPRPRKQVKRGLCARRREPQVQRWHTPMSTGKAPACADNTKGFGPVLLTAIGGDVIDWECFLLGVTNAFRDTVISR